MYTVKYYKYMPKYIYNPIESAKIEDYIICNSEFSKKNKLNDLIYLKTINLNFYLEKGQYICGDVALKIIQNKSYYKMHIHSTQNTFNNKLLHLIKTCNFIETKMYYYIFKISVEFKNYMFRFGFNITYLQNIKIFKQEFESKIDILQSFELDSYRIIINRKGHVYTTVNGYFALIKKINVINIFNDSNKLLNRIIKHENTGYKTVHFFASTNSFKTLPTIEINRLIDLENPETILLLNLFNIISGNFGKLFYVNNKVYKKTEFIETYINNQKKYDWGNFIFIDNIAHNFDITAIILNKIHCIYPYYYNLSTKAFNNIPIINKINNIYNNPIKRNLLYRNTEIMYIYIGLKKNNICKPLIWNIIAFYFKLKILKTLPK